MLRGLAVKRGHPNPRRKEPRMAHPQHTPTLASLEEAITVLFCLVDDTYTLLNPEGEATSRSRGSRTPRSLPWRSSSSLGA